MIDCVDYVITHKPFPVEQDELYRKLCVGNYCDDINLSEREGDNIAEYNDRLNECTGLYWMWKNASSKYIGLSHYRRFFECDGHKLNISDIEKILVDDGCNLILSEPVNLRWTVYQNISIAVGDRLSSDVYHLFKQAMPNKLQAFDEVMGSHRMYVCNMFVTSKEIMDRYCEWLFSFLLDVTDQIKTDGLNFTQKRVAGYFAETMWTVWMLNNYDIKVKTLPIVVSGQKVDWT